MLRTKPKYQYEVSDALERISTGLLMLEQSNLEATAGRIALDVTAKLNAQYLKLQGIVEARKDRIKADNADTVPTTFVRGLLYRARIKRYKKQFLNLDRVRVLLGMTKFNRCHDTRQIEEISFEVMP